MKTVVRVLAAILAFVVALMAALPSESASASTATTIAHVYDTTPHPDASMAATTERGPPEPCQRAGDHRPRRHDQDRLPRGSPVMMRPPLDEFLAGEVDDFVRSELLAAIEQLDVGQCYFTYNAFNVFLDGDACTATVEDELDVNRQSTVGLDEFRALLAGGDGP